MLMKGTDTYRSFYFGKRLRNTFCSVREHANLEMFK